MSCDVRRKGLGGRQRLPVADDADLIRNVVGAADRSPQRDLFRRVAADYGIFHVEVGERDGKLGRALEPHAARRKFGQQIALAVDHLRRDVAGHFEDIELPRTEHQEPRIRLFDDRDFDATDLRQALALHRRGNGLDRRVGIGGGGREALIAIRGVGFENDAMAGLPLLEAIRTGTNRMIHRTAAGIPVFLDDLAGHGA